MTEMLSQEESGLQSLFKRQPACLGSLSNQFVHEMQITLPKYVRSAERTFLLAALLKVLTLTSVFPPLIFKPLGEVQLFQSPSSFQ